MAEQQATGGPTIDKEGLLEKRSGSTQKDDAKKKKHSWNRYYFKLAGSALYYYSNDKSEKARGVVTLTNVQIGESVESSEKKYQITLKTNEFTFVIAASSEVEHKAWFNAIILNKEKQLISLPIKGQPASDLPNTPGILFKAKKNLAGKAAVSGMGKAVIKKVIDDEIKQVITSVKHIIEVETGQKEFADRLEKNTIKIAVKAYFLWENKTIPLEKYETVEGPLRQGLKILLAVYNNIEKVKDEKLKKEILEEKFTVVAVLFDQVQSTLTDLFKPHLKPKSINRIKETFDTIARQEFLERAYTDPSLTSDVACVMAFVKSYIVQN